MLSTVNFDGQALRKTHKIEHVFLQRRLSSEAHAELAVPQPTPETAFGVGHVASQFAGDFGYRFRHIYRKADRRERLGREASGLSAKLAELYGK